MADVDATQSIKDVFSLQEERIKVYHQLDQAHQAYLHTGPDYDFPAFRQVVHDCTEEFSRISKRVLALEENFKEVFHRDEIAGLIRKLQEHEQIKLHLTGLLQLSRQRQQDSPCDLGAEEVTQLKYKIKSTIGEIAEVLQDLRYEAEDLLT